MTSADPPGERAGLLTLKTRPWSCSSRLLSPITQHPHPTGAPQRLEPGYFQSSNFHSSTFQEIIQNCRSCKQEARVGCELHTPPQGNVGSPSGPLTFCTRGGYEINVSLFRETSRLWAP